MSGTPDSGKANKENVAEKKDGSEKVGSTVISADAFLTRRRRQCDICYIIVCESFEANYCIEIYFEVNILSCVCRNLLPLRQHTL